MIFYTIDADKNHFPFFGDYIQYTFDWILSHGFPHKLAVESFYSAVYNKHIKTLVLYCFRRCLWKESFYTQI